MAYLDSDLERDIEREVKLGSIRSSLGGGEDRQEGGGDESGCFGETVVGCRDR